MSNLGNLGDAFSGDLIEFLKWQRIEYNKFLATKFRENLNYKYELDMLGKPVAELKKENQELRVRSKEKRARESHTNWVFITISPKDTVPFSKFKETCIKFAQRKMFNKSWLVFEQRGKNLDECGKGFHAHIECERNVEYKPSQIIRNTKNTFKNMCNLTVPSTLTVQHHGDDYHEDKMEYIKGVKTGDGKDKKQLVDVKFRQKNNLEVCYKYYAEA